MIARLRFVWASLRLRRTLNRLRPDFDRLEAINATIDRIEALPWAAKARPEIAFACPAGHVGHLLTDLGYVEESARRDWQMRHGACADV